MEMKLRNKREKEIWNHAYSCGVADGTANGRSVGRVEGIKEANAINATKDKLLDARIKALNSAGQALDAVAHAVCSIMDNKT